MPREIDLTQQQRDALREVFARFVDCFDLVGVYGSRVQGKARPGSDVDLVLFGPVGPQDASAIRLALEESDLSIFADVVVYDDIQHQPLKAQIDHWMEPLFTKSDIAGADALRAA